MGFVDMSSQAKFNESGFTLVEMMVVVIIIAILAVIAYPSMTSQIAKMRINSAKSSIANAVKDAQSQSVILRKPIWIVVNNNDDVFSIVLQDEDPNSGQAPRFNVQTTLPNSIRLVNSSGSIADTINTLRVTPSGSFQNEQGGSYAPATYDFYVCDVIYQGNTSVALRFQNRATPIASNAVTESVVCNLS